MSTYKTLQVGSTGEDVKKLQNALVSAGYDVGKTGADGIYGANTQKAVRSYQKDKGLAIDGIAGSQTLGSLYSSGETAQSEPQSPAAKEAPLLYNPEEDSAYRKAVEKLEQTLQNMPVYTPEYESQLGQLYEQIMGRKGFSYDSNQDTLYRQYRDLYETQGKMAMMDTMAQSVALTGGYANSFAQNAAQQAYQSYLQQLSAKVPEFYDRAKAEYDRQGQALLDQYALLEDKQAAGYESYQDQLAQYWKQVQLEADQVDAAYARGYESYRDARKDFQWDQEFAQKQAEFAQEQAEFAQKQKEADRDYQLALQKYYSSLNSKKQSQEEKEQKQVEEQVQVQEKLDVLLPEKQEEEAALTWDAGMWEGHFAKIRQTLGTDAAEYEMDRLIGRGVLPTNMVVYAAIGARGAFKRPE